MKDEYSKRLAKRRWWLAGLFSYFVPGLGQVYNGRALRGLLIYCLFSIWGSVIFNIGLHAMRSGFPGGYTIAFFLGLVISLLIGLWIIIDAIRGTRRNGSAYHLKPYNRWYLYLLAIAISQGESYFLKNSVKDILVEPFKIRTVSMSPTLEPGDLILCNRLYYARHNVQRGDLIVFAYPKDERLDYVKRVAAIPGDTVIATDQKVYVNGHLLKMDGRLDPSQTLQDEWVRQAGVSKEVVPADYYYVIGDNLMNSLDSRHWGPVARHLIHGKTSIVYLSIKRRFPFIRFDRIGKRL